MVCLRAKWECLSLLAVRATWTAPCVALGAQRLLQQGLLQQVASLPARPDSVDPDVVWRQRQRHAAREVVYASLGRVVSCYGGDSHYAVD